MAAPDGIVNGAKLGRSWFRERCVMGPSRWTADAAAGWRQRTGLIIGCNFTPGYAANQIEFWSSDTFDRKAIEAELDLVRSVGFNVIRIYLHDLCFTADARHFLDCIDAVLDAAARRGIGVVPVIFDSVWHPFPVAGRQREPERGVHNAGWVQSPGLAVLRDQARFAALQSYVTTLIGKFCNDPRVLMWDLWNEPDNENIGSYGDRDAGRGKAALVLPLLDRVFDWARAAEPTQPLTSAVWFGDWSPLALSALERLQLDRSDVITFHNYGPPGDLHARIAVLQAYQRPLICTEWMARPLGSTFAACLPVFVETGVGSMCWGLVRGRSQCHLPWETWRGPAVGEPDVWFHDVFRRDHSAYDENEIALITSVTAAHTQRFEVR